MEWTEDLVIDRPLPEVLSAIADERELMQWSAWPQATGFSCNVDGDGVSPGSAIVSPTPRDASRVAKYLRRLPLTGLSTGCATGVQRVER